MRAMVTGGRGFVGGHLVAHLESCGDVVVAIDLEHDVANAAEMTEVVRDHQPDAIYHLAAISHVGASWDDPSDVLRVNVLGTAAVLAAARHLATPATTLLTSSAEVYGTVSADQLPLHELMPARPVSPYGASKMAAEVVALQAVRGFGQSVIVARSFNHFGPGQSQTFFVPAMARRLLLAARNNDGSVPVGNLDSRRDFTDVRDVVRAYRLLVVCGQSGEIYNVASGVDRSMREIATALRDLIDPSLAFATDPALLRPSDVPVLRGDASKLKAATKWSPLIQFNVTLGDVVQSVRSQL